MLKLQHFGHLMRRADSLWKDPDAGEDWGKEDKGVTEDKMVGWYHEINGHESEQTPGVGDEQERLVRCSLWGCKESDTTQQQPPPPYSYKLGPEIKGKELQK